VYASLEALLADETVDLIVNLTVPYAHAEVTRTCFMAGKDVYSEKPLALTSEPAWDLVRLARGTNRRLSCAPITILGEAQQTAWKAIRDGMVGTIRLVYAEANWGRVETELENPLPFFEIGPLFDVGIYPLTILTTVFGPVRRVTGFCTTQNPQRVTKDAIPFQITTLACILAALEFLHGFSCSEQRHPKVDTAPKPSRTASRAEIALGGERNQPTFPGPIIMDHFFQF